MTEVGPVDRSRHLAAKQQHISSILTSRKRKLTELFAVTTDPNVLHTHDSTRPGGGGSSSSSSSSLPVSSSLQAFLDSFDILKSVASSLPRAVDYPPVASGARPARPLADRRRRGKTFEKEKEKVPAYHLASAARVWGPASSPAPTVHEKAAATTPNATSRTDSKPVRIPSSSSTSDPPHVTTPSTTNEPVSSLKETQVQLVPDAKTARGTIPVDVSNSQGDRPALGDGTSSRSPSQSAVPKPSTSTVEEPTAATRESPNAPISPSTDAVTAPPKPVAPKVASQDESPQAQPPAAKEPVVERGLDTGAHDHGGSSKGPEIASSPGSTTHTATTPAAHEASTNTSPDNDGPQYVERVPEAAETGARKEEDAKAKDSAATAPVTSTAPSQVKTPVQERVPLEPPSSGGYGPEAQLLSESQNALQAQQKPTAARVSGSRIQGAKPTIKPPVSVSQPQPLTPASTSIQDDNLVPVPDSMDIDSPPKPAAPESPLSPQVAKILTPQVSEVAELGRKSEATGAQETPEKVEASAPANVALQKAEPEILGETSKGINVPKYPPEEGRRDDYAAEEKKAVVVRKAKRAKRVAPPSAVVFAKSPRQRSREVVSTKKDGLFDDYFTPLFIQGFTQTPKSWMKPIDALLHHAHKTVSTEDSFVSIHENQACRVLRRVYHLQQGNKWALRQPERVAEPPRPETHWDVLLKEMKWMRKDFRQERKWKMQVAKNLADDCADWVNSTPEERKSLQVKAVIPPQTAEANDEIMPDAAAEVAQAPAADAPVDEEVPVEDADECLPTTIAPSAIFALPNDQVVFSLQPSVASDQLLRELPVFMGPLQPPVVDPLNPTHDPDARWKRPALALTKYVESSMELISEEPPRKRTRYRYKQEDEDEDDYVVVGRDPQRPANLPPELPEVGLFRNDLKHVRDRLHAGHQFRPPSESPMPPQSFFESRQASQWMPAEDEQLRSLVGEYSYNWSMIADTMRSRSMFASGPERRTPWECFERWIMLEGLPGDMQKTAYFRQYSSRIANANTAISQMNEALQKIADANPTGAATPVPRKRPTNPIKVERRRNQKHLSLIEAMRKLAKKRETAAVKAQQQTQAAANRKTPNDPASLKKFNNPAEASSELDRRNTIIKEKLLALSRNHEAVSRRAQMQSRIGAAQMAAAAAAGIKPQQGPGQLPANLRAQSQLGSVAGQPRPRIPMQNMGNPQAQLTPQQLALAAQLGVTGFTGQFPTNALQQAQLIRALQASQQQSKVGMGSAQMDVDIRFQAKLVADQQRQAVLKQKHQQQLLQQQQQQQQQQNQGQGQSHHAPHSQQQPPHQQPHAPQQLQQAQQTQQVAQHPQQQQQQQHAPNGTPRQASPQSSQPMMNGSLANHQNFLANSQAAALASFNGTTNGSSMSPPPQTTTSQAGGNAQAGGSHGILSYAQLPPQVRNSVMQLENQIRSKHPNLPPEQVRQAAYETLIRMSSNRPMNFQPVTTIPTGVSTPAPLSNGVQPTSSPQQYAQLLRAQQEAQARQQEQARAAQQQQQQQGNSASPPMGPPQTSPTIQSLQQQALQRSPSVGAPLPSQASPPAPSPSVASK